MIILGIDPGIARVGWAIVHKETHHLSASSYGCITTQKTNGQSERLLQVHTQLRNLVSAHHPDAIAVEELFFATNVKTAISVSQARGIILLVAAQEKIPVISYTPLAVKRAICGDGHADKLQVTRMVMRLLHLKETPKPDDTADALAIALTHAYSYKMKAMLS